MAGANLQDLFLNIARKEREPVTLFLTNGYQIKGVVAGYDAYVIMMEVGGKQNMVYKHAVSTIVPLNNVKYNVANEQE